MCVCVRVCVISFLFIVLCGGLSHARAPADVYACACVCACLCVVVFVACFPAYCSIANNSTHNELRLVICFVSQVGIGNACAHVVAFRIVCFRHARVYALLICGSADLFRHAHCLACQPDARTRVIAHLSVSDIHSCVSGSKALLPAAVGVALPPAPCRSVDGRRITDGNSAGRAGPPARGGVICKIGANTSGEGCLRSSHRKRLRDVQDMITQPPRTPPHGGGQSKHHLALRQFQEKPQVFLRARKVIMITITSCCSCSSHSPMRALCSRNRTLEQSVFVYGAFDAAVRREIEDTSKIFRKNQTHSPSYVQLLGARSRICAAYAALYEFLKPEARQGSLSFSHDLVGIKSFASIEDAEARGIPEIDKPEFNSQTAPSAIEDLSTTLQAIASSETAQHSSERSERPCSAHAGDAILARGHHNAKLTDDEDVRVLADLLNGVEAEYKFTAACQLALDRLKAAFLQAPHDIIFVYMYIYMFI